MNIDDLTLGQIKNLKAIFGGPETCCSEELGTQICVLQRGWVVVGCLSKQGSQYSLKNGAVIRVWGTKKGLGELAMNGPTKDTTLDLISDSKFHELTLVLRMDCVESEWKNKIK